MSKKSAKADRDDDDPAPPAPTPNRRGLALKILLIVAVAAGGALGILWWQDRELREARSALAAKDAEQALRLTEAYLEKHPDSASAMALKARTLVALDEQPEEAIRLFDRVGVADLDEMYAYAQAHLKVQQWSVALPYLVEVTDKRSNDAEALHALTLCRIQLGMLVEALQSAELATRCEGHEAKGHVLMATTYRKLNDPVSAAAEYGRVLNFEPEAANLQLTPAEFTYEFGRTLLDAGDAAKAAPQLVRSVELGPTAPAYAALGEAYSILRQTPRAVAAWKEALKLDPLEDTARQGLAAVALRDNDARQALEWLKPLETQGRGLSNTALLLATAYEAIKDEPAAATWRQRAAAISAREKHASEVQRLMLEDPGSTWARAARAHTFAAAGNWKQAEAMLDGLPEKPQGDVKKYVDMLAEAIRNKTPLPPLEKVSIPLPAGKQAAKPPEGRQAPAPAPPAAGQN
jgi:tetratricopeptide (TPR) repeat protein